MHRACFARVRGALHGRAAAEHHACVYGRDVGDAVERIDLDQSVQAISASELRKKLSAGSWSMIPKKPAPDLIRL
jgi:hypothetical protein